MIVYNLNNITNPEIIDLIINDPRSSVGINPEAIIISDLDKVQEAKNINENIYHQKVKNIPQKYQFKFHSLSITSDLLLISDSEYPDKIEINEQIYYWYLRPNLEYNFCDNTFDSWVDMKMYLLPIAMFRQQKLEKVKKSLNLG